MSPSPFGIEGRRVVVTGACSFSARRRTASPACEITAPCPTSSTGRWFDAAAVKLSIRINSVSGICLTKLDVLDGLSEIKVCTGYMLRGERIDILPLDADDIVACEPIYESFPGWEGSTFGITEWDKLPNNARAYLERVQGFIGAPIDMVSTGPDRDHTILLRHPYKG
mgnify:CR=1 FL=1